MATMKISVQILPSKKISFDVEPTDTCKYLISKISNSIGLPVHCLRLFGPDGKEPLEGDKFLSDYGLDGSDADDAEEGASSLICKRLILVNIRGHLPITVSPAASPDKMKKSLNSAFKKWYDSIKKIPFYLESSDYVVDGSCKPNSTLSLLYKHIQDSEYFEIESSRIPAKMKAKMFDELNEKRLTKLSPIRLSFNLDSNGGNDDERSKKIDGETRLSLPIDYASEKEIQFTVNIDLFEEFTEDTGLKGLPKTLISSLRRQIEEMRSCVQTFFDLDTSKILLPKAYHYRLKDHSSSLVTLIYPASLSDSDLTDYRRKLHEKMSLPFDRPYIRKANSLKLDGNSFNQKYIINPHLSVPRSGSNTGKVTTVQGNYAYHHYTQDGFNDVGWGCAYRSLQTIISWFMLQGYIEIERVPTHREIQEALVACGDKEANFIGREKWIGSQEVSYVLSQLYDISSKIMFVSSGRELGSKGSELKHHFEKNGTPIMIGGGVLAHTIIGIDFDEKSGKLDFLVLDPHYTGPEDLSTIVKKGWCNWKSPDFWDQSAFYNLCMPQKPQVF